MKTAIVGTAAVAALISGATADLCDKGKNEIGGNWYCQAVKGITYKNVKATDYYMKTTNMDSSSHTCQQARYDYSCDLGPLSEELSVHVRGPINFSKFAAYSLSSGSSSSGNQRRSAGHKHGHERFHARRNEAKAEQDKRALKTVTFTADWGAGPTEATFVTDDGAPAASAAPVASATPDVSMIAPVNKAVDVDTGSSSAAASPASSSEASSSEASSSKATSSSAPQSTGAAGTWDQTAYYDGASQTSNGLTFLGNLGGQGSGVWDATWGNSLSYINQDACEGAASATTFNNAMLASSKQFAIVTDKKCEEGDSCSYHRPGSVAYHGFGGSAKAFFFEFDMPDRPQDAAAGTEGNMPAIWVLNDAISHTMQYGFPECSPWTSGGGEFDIFEVLNGADEQRHRAKSTLHGRTDSTFQGGDSDYFQRPEDGKITVGVVMWGTSIHIQIMDNFSWSENLDSSVIQRICDDTNTQSDDVSIFELNTE